MKVKLIALLLVVSFCVPLASCAKKTEEDIIISVPETSEAYPMKVQITDDGNSEYKIINKKEPGDILLRASIDFYSRIRDFSGVTLGRNNDVLYDNEDPSESYEILFANTNRAESQEVYASIGYDGYAVKKVGNKIVIAAYTQENLSRAVDAFFNECVILETDGTSTDLYYVRDSVHVGEQGLFFTEENPITSYKIVYSVVTSPAATDLAIELDDEYGIDIGYLNEKDPEAEHEIIVGDVDRSAAEQVPNGAMGYCTIKAVGKKLVIKSDGAIGLKEAVSAVMHKLAAPCGAFNFPKDVDMAVDLYISEDRVELTPGADVRVMAFNILNEKWAASRVLEPRVPGMVGCVNAYKPDVIGFQEVSEKLYSILIPLLPDYKFANKDLHGKTDNAYTVVAYRKDSVELINTNLLVYSKCSNNRLRILNSAAFKHKATGKTFIVTSTHLDVSNAEHREVQATEHLERVERLIKAYNCPVISTGDYNSREGSQPHVNLTGNGVIKYAKRDALEKGKILNTCPGVGITANPSENSIDHIFYTDGVTPMYYSTIVDRLARLASDHTPLICDFKFN